MNGFVDTFFSVVKSAGVPIAFCMFLLYFPYRKSRDCSRAWKQRKVWLHSHFPEPEYTKEYLDAIQFVAALLESTEDTVVWQYYDRFDEARKVEGGFDKLCSLDCCAKEGGSPGLLFMVTGNKVKVACNPPAVRVILRITLQYQKLHCWIQEQPQYAGFSLETVSHKEINTVLSTPGVSLWGYVSAWEDAVIIPPEKYYSIDAVTYYTLFIVEAEAKRIYQPLLELSQEEE